MNEPVIERRPDGPVNCFFKGNLWKRFRKPRNDEVHSHWYKTITDGRDTKLQLESGRLARQLEAKYRTGEHDRTIRRFPRLVAPDRIIHLRDIPRTLEIDANQRGWLVDELIPEGSLVLVTAPPGEYKTWLALSLASAVSTGALFLRRKTAETTVLYLDRDNPLRVVCERRRILRLREGKRLKIWGRWLPDSPPEIGDPRHLKFARRYRPLIIFDSFVRFHSAQENSATDMAKVIEALRRLTDAGATVILLHHRGKSETSRYRGSTDIHAGVDVAFAIETRKKRNSPPILTLHCFKHRLLEEFQLTLRPNLKNGCFEIIDDPSAANTIAIVKKVQALIKKIPGITQQELIKRCGLPETNGRDLLLREDGKFWFTKRGEKKSLRYYLTKEDAA